MGVYIVGYNFIDEMIQPCLTACDSIITEVNKEFIEFTGFTLEELFGKSITEIGDLLRINSQILLINVNSKYSGFIFTKSLEVRGVDISIIKGQETNEKIYTFIEKSNSRLDDKLIFEEQARIIKYQNAKLEQQNELLSKQTNLLSTILDNTTEGIVVADAKGKLLSMNPVALRIYGFSSLEEYKNIKNFASNCEVTSLDGRPIPSEERPRSRAFRGEFFTDYEMCVYSKENNRRWIGSYSGAPIYDEKGEMSMIIITLRDITERKKVEMEIKSQKELLEAVIETMYDALAVYDKKGNVILMNAECRKLYPYFNEQSKVSNVYNGFQFFDLDNNILPVENLPRRRVFKGERIRNERIIIKHLETTQYIEINATPIFDSKNNLISAVVSHHDITKKIKNQKKIRDQQEQLLRTEKEKNEALEKSLEMKDEFLSLISHEFRTPLNVINSAVQAMNYICGNELSDKAKGYMKMIRQNTFRQLRLVNDILDITRINSGRVNIHKKNMDIVFLTKAITESVYAYASHKSITLTFITSLGKKIIAIDEEKYERIILNLLSNAIKFTPEGASIIVTLRSAKGNICIEVKDSGIGIPKDKLDVIFERFGQVDSSLSRQAEGSGIGLSLVKRLVVSLGGSITVKSSVGRGSTFIILLPDEKAIEENVEKPQRDFLDDRLVQITNIEFSDIY